jgi:hypothetical protein
VPRVASARMLAHGYNNSCRKTALIVDGWVEEVSKDTVNGHKRPKRKHRHQQTGSREATHDK